MNLKIFLTAFASLLLSALPENMIGCGGSEDPYDYFTSFFNRDATSLKGYQPFYYTALLDFYDDWQYDEQADYEEDLILQEWKKYVGQNADIKSTKEFIYDYKKEIVDQLLNNITAGKALSIPDSVRNNALTKYFLSQKNAPALKYLSFAKETEKFSASSDWDKPVERDSLTLNSYISKATTYYEQESSNFLKDKYALQRCKLAFYNNRFKDCTQWYDAHFTLDNKSASQQLSQSYKAGSLYHLGRNKEAAYEFSKAFAKSGNNKKPVYLGFLWATEYCNKDNQMAYAALGKTSAEKANIIGMFGLYGIDYALATMKQVYALDPSSPLLQILAIREINKIEEQYLTPMLAKEKGGKAFYYSWVEEDSAKATQPQIAQTIQFFETLSKDKALNNAALYATGAAYLSFINKDYNKAKSFIAQAKSLSLTDKLNDQLQLINLLIMANEKPTLDAEREKQILPSVQWLVKKAKDDGDYLIFLRNLFSQIIAQKYEQQGDLYRAALSYGMADANFISTAAADEGYYVSGNGLEYVRNEMSTDQLLKLYNLFTATNKTPFEQFVTQNASFKQDHVIDVIGTSYLRDFNFEKAIEWLKKGTKPEVLTATNYNYKTDKEITVNVDPFFDYLNDWQRYNKAVAKPYNKLSFAQKLLETQVKADTTKNEEAKSKLYYQLASAFYNMSYYGNSWAAVAYFRTSSDWNTGTYDAPWKREYFGVYKAKDFYQKAHDLTKNKEFKAACYFMMAKCVQRQIPMPDYDYKNWEEYEKKLNVFAKKFKNNPMFDGFVKQYGTTKFYNYTLTRCSYLSDFVKTARKTK